MKIEYILAIVMALVLIGTGAASQIVGTFYGAFGILGAFAGYFLVLSLVVAVFDKK